MKVLCTCRGLVQAGLFSRASCRHRLRMKLRVGFFYSTSVREPGGTLEEEETSKQFRATMRLVPSSVAVVTAGDGAVKRGVTCNSFTSVSLHPPVVSFSIQQPSRMHDLLVATQRFAVHVLSEKQVHYSVHFSRPVPSHQDQFDSIPHQLGLASVPLLPDCCAVLQCAAHTVHDVGDHHVWYGKVLHAAVRANETPLLYYARSYHSVGDAAFMRAFETATLGYEEWTHEAHLRMAWNYITAYGREEATPLIKAGINNYINKNIGKVKIIYNETITLFFIHVVDRAVQKFEGRPHLFEEFLAENPHLMDAQLLSRHYSAGRIRSQQARESWLEPDLEPLP